MEQEEIGGGLEVLEADLAELENSVYHLVRSNVELAMFLEEAQGDEDLKQALEENKAVLVKKRHRIKALQYAISDLKSQRPHLVGEVAPSASTAASIFAGGMSVPSSSSAGSAGSAGSASSIGTGARPWSVGGSVVGPSDRGVTTVPATSRRPSSDGVAGDAISPMTASASLDAATPPPRTTPPATGCMSDSRQDSGTVSAADFGGATARSVTARGEQADQTAPVVGENGFGLDGEGGVLL